MERQFTKEIESLRLGDGEVFHGEGILAVTKALLQSGVSYVGGYQGAPVSHLLDVMVQARAYLDELGVHVEACTSEAAAAAMLGASVNYPARGAVTWKSVVGTNVAADALSYLASAGVMGGTLIVLGEDYGEGGVVAQERSHAFAMKSLMWLLHPPAIFRQEKLKSDVRLPAARKFIAEHKLNEVFPGAEGAVGIIVQGGLYNGLMLALKTLGLADPWGGSRIPILALNVVYPLLPEELVEFSKTKK